MNELINDLKMLMKLSMLHLKFCWPWRVNLDRLDASYRRANVSCSCCEGHSRLNTVHSLAFSWAVFCVLVKCVALISFAFHITYMQPVLSVSGCEKFKLTCNCFQLNITAVSHSLTHSTLWLEHPASRSVITHSLSLFLYSPNYSLSQMCSQVSEFGSDWFNMNWYSSVVQL